MGNREARTKVLFYFSLKEKFRKQKNWKILISSATEDKFKFNNDKGKLLYILNVKENKNVFIKK